jgi:hypothetical protein
MMRDEELVISILKHAGAIVCLTLAFLLGAAPTKALEEFKVYRGVLILEGNIVPGDYLKFRNFLGTRSNFDKINGGVFLASRGGNMGEATRIGRLIRALRLSTEAPSGPPSGTPKFGESLITPNNLVNPRADYVCSSACFFIFVAGIYRNLNWAGRLGVHRPIRLEGVAKPLSTDETLVSNFMVRETAKKYLEEMDVPDKYLDLMFSVPPNEIRWITQKELDSDFRGFVPEFRDWVGAKCNPHSSHEKGASDDLRTSASQLNNARIAEKEKMFAASAKQSTEIIKCWMQVKNELPIDAWHNVFFDK